MKVLVTGSSGLIGSEAVEHFDRQGHEVTGVDNNMRRVFFGPTGDTLWNLERLKRTTKRFTHASVDIRDRALIEELFRTQRFDLIVHCAAQCTIRSKRCVRNSSSIRARSRISTEACVKRFVVRLSLSKFHSVSPVGPKNTRRMLLSTPVTS